MAQAYEFGFEGQNLFVLGGSAMHHEQTPDMINGIVDLDEIARAEEAVESQAVETTPDNEVAKVLRFQRAVHHADVIGEALQDLAEVVPLDKARKAVNEAFGLTGEQSVDNSVQNNIATLPPTGTAHELYPVTSLQPVEKSGPQLVNETYVPTHESIVKHEITARGARREDIEALVDVDIRAFEGVYKNYGKSHDELRQELIEKFTGRYDMLGSRWMRVVERDGIIAGHITCCPTNKTPEEFESWEKTTDNGTLKTTYDPNGENIYVVSLSMLPGVGEAARNMLFADQIGKFVEGGFKQAFFESRLPGLGAWVRRECENTGRDFDALSKDEQSELAEQYFHATKTVKGKEVPLDRLLRIYAGAGCKFTRIVADAYDDVPSMNFGAVGIYENPLPKFARNNRIARKVVGKTIQALAKSHWLMQKAF